MKEEHALICLGANTPDAPERLAAARELLRGIAVIDRETPEYGGETVPYHNQLLWLTVTVGYDTLAAAAKNYQTEVRVLAHTAPLVAIDIDIVEWNGVVLRPKDAQARYFCKGLSPVNA